MLTALGSFLAYRRDVHHRDHWPQDTILYREGETNGTCQRGTGFPSILRPVSENTSIILGAQLWHVHAPWEGPLIFLALCRTAELTLPAFDEYRDSPQATGCCSLLLLTCKCAS